MTPMASAPVHQLRRVAARHRALPVAPSDTHQAAPRAGPDGRIAPDHAPRTLTVPACPLTTVANRDGLLPRLVLPSSDPVRHLLNRTRSRADTPGASRAAQSVVTSKTATSRLSRRGPAAAEPEGATRQVPAALPAGVARPPGLCARGGGRTHHPWGQGARPHGDGQRRASHGDHGVDADARSALAEQEAARGDIGDGAVDAGPATQRHGAPVTISGATSRRGAPP
jgi:hypothetical protein